jgi:hypothetical protein
VVGFTELAERTDVEVLQTLLSDFLQAAPKQGSSATAEQSRTSSETK